MKRKVSLIICIVFAMTASVIMTSCGKSSERALDPYKILKAASDKWKNIKDIDMDMSLNMTDNSKRTNAKIDANIKQVIISGNDPDMIIDMNLNIPSQNINTEITFYYKDSICYADALGYKVKYKTDMSKMKQMAGLSLDSMGLSPEITDKATATPDGNNTKLYFKVKPEKAKERLEKALSSSMISGSSLKSRDLKSGNLIIEALVDKDNNFKSCSMKFNLNGNIRLDTQILINKVNSGLTLNFPSFKGYEEQGELGLF